MKRALIVIILAAATCVQADVLVYKFAQTNIVTGGGAKFRDAPIYGRIVLDADTGEGAVISWVPKFKYVGIDCPDAEFKYVRGARNSSESSWFVQGGSYDEAGNNLSIMFVYLRGVNTALTIADGRQLAAPRLLRGTYRGSHEMSDGTVYIGEGNIVATYLSGETQAANANGLFVHEVIDQWMQLWLDRGYTEVYTDAPCF
jgi:hypothetical protein